MFAVAYLWYGAEAVRLARSREAGVRAETAA
jgi:hypothetical protein